MLASTAAIATAARTTRLAGRSFSQTASARFSDKPDPSRAHDAATNIETGPETPATDAPQQRPKPRRRGLLITAAVCLFLGTTLGGLVRMTFSPPPLPAPGTREDELLAASLREKAARLPIVKQLSSDPQYDSWDAYEDRVGTGVVSIGSGPMSGSRGLAYQRIFLNRATGELISVIYLGGAMSGFPGVVHGGTLAIVLDETMGRCAINRFPARTGVTANLDLTYKRPTMTNAFYVVRCRPLVNEADEVVGSDGTKKGDRKLWVHGTVENLSGDVQVESKALFVVPKGTRPSPMALRW